jgi:hypothetical protein
MLSPVRRNLCREVANHQNAHHAVRRRAASQSMLVSRLNGFSGQSTLCKEHRHASLAASEHQPFCLQIRRSPDRADNWTPSDCVRLPE